MAVRIRRNAGTLATWDPILEWYAKAVREMQSRPITDPASWRYQAPYVCPFTRWVKNVIPS